MINYNYYNMLPCVPVSRPKALALTIRALVASGFAVGGILPVHANGLPVPAAPVALTRAPIEIASQGHAKAAVAGKELTIHQLTDKATLGWKSFNIGLDNKVTFKQPSSTSVALNNIRQNDASKILGSLTANGQVYLVNQNGFLFGKNSQVNVNSLVATTLGIRQADFQAGITKVFDLNKKGNDYVNKAAALNGNGEIYLKNAKGNFLLDQKGQKIKVQVFVSQGANIKTNAPGGRVIIAAPSITNNGTIETPDGQAILAASKDKVYLQETTDADIRGLLVEVGTGGEVNNVGKVLAERGNASLVGFAVNQKGIASATTSVGLNGSVRLLAREGIKNFSESGGRLVPDSTIRNNGSSATVTLNSGSVTSVDLDNNKQATAIDIQEQPRSKIEISGHKIILQNKSMVRAHSGDVTINAIDDDPTKHDARIYLEKGSKVDVSGVKNVPISTKRNVLNVELRKNELRDAPLQRNGVLFSKTVAVDVRDVSLSYDDKGKLATATIPVADVKGAVNRIARNIDERSTSGGSINLNSSGDVIAKAGSTLDFSGGSVAYQASSIKTSKLVSGGRVYDIAKADPNRHYDRIIANSHFDPGYVDGKNGGQLNLSAYEAVLDGKLQGQVIAGAKQRLADDRAVGSSLNIELSTAGVYSKQDVVFDGKTVAKPVTVNGKLGRKNGSSSNQPPVALAINSGLLSSSGVSNVNIKTSGSVTVNKGATIGLPALGQLNLSAQDFDIKGTIVAPSGTVDLHPIKLGDVFQPSSIKLGPSALIDVSGLWVNDLLDVRQRHSLATVNTEGGSVNLSAEQRDLKLEKGSRINANGGGWNQSKSNVISSNGGTIKLSAGNHNPIAKPGSLVLKGDLAAWGIQQDGSLALETNEVVIGPAKSAPKHLGSTLQPLVLAPSFFQKGGFSSYDITSNYYGLKVANNVQVDLQQLNLQANAAKIPTGSLLLGNSNIVKLPDYLRNPVDLKLSYSELAGKNIQETLQIGKGALIRTDAQGGVELNSNTSIIVDGTVKAPAGNIALNIDTPASVVGYLPSQGIWLGAGSQLLAQGILDSQISENGLKKGEVLPGGAVDLTANRGYIVSRAGSLIDVSGTKERLDFPQPTTTDSGFRVNSQEIASAGGTISFKAGEGILADGILKAKAGDNSVSGGNFSVTIDRNLRIKPDAFLIEDNKFPDDIKPLQPYRIEITSNNSNTVPRDLPQRGNIDANKFSGRALLKSSRINQAEFDSLFINTDATVVNGKYTSGVLFNGPVQLNADRQIVIDSPSLQTSGGHVTFNTAYATLGSTQTQNNSSIAPEATTGIGQFDVRAKAIELTGGLGFNGFGKVNLASSGDLRMRGILKADSKTYKGQLNVNGDLKLQAGQIYPATLTDYTINITGSGDKSATFLKSVDNQSPIFSAGGKLTVNAPNIFQGGRLKAPFGTLTLNAEKTLQLTAGSLTSVSGAGSSVLFGQGSGGAIWLYPLDSAGQSNIVIDKPPEKRLELTGKKVNLQLGSTIDLSGGGNLYAYEFITGSGGSNDILDPTVVGYNQKFAVLPGFKSTLTPYDFLESKSSGLTNADSVYLNAGGGLSAGWYTLLPAHYALLPGAYLVTPKNGTQDQYQTKTDFAGTKVVAGRYGVAGTGIQSARTQGFAVEPGANARIRSEYKDYTANEFFSNIAAKEGSVAPQLPQDAGSLAINAKTNISLSPNLIANAVGNGLGGQVDISADRLAIVARRENLSSVAPGTVGLLVDDLNNLKAPSLLLGGKRSKDSKGQRVTALSDQVIIGRNSDLKGQEILITAINEVRVNTGAVVESNGKSATDGGVLTIDNANATSDAALLRVSDSGQATVVRDKAVTGNGGILTVESGARLKAGGSMLLDSSKNTVFDGIIDMKGGSLALNSSSISVGAVPTGTSGLVLANTNFNIDELLLNSAHDFDIYGAVKINSKHVEISTANINGFNNAGTSASISSDMIKLTNQGATAERTGTGNGKLTFNAREIQLGSGKYAINGFDNVNFNASKAINGQGQAIDPITGNSSTAAPGILNATGDLTLKAGYFSGGNGATTSIDASGHTVTLVSPKTILANRNPGLGVRWSVIGDSLSSNAHFDLPSGILELKALNGDLNLKSGSSVDLSGRIVTFADTYRASGAGSLSLTANRGNVNLMSGANINLEGASLANSSGKGAGLQVSDAGLMTVNASNGQFNWDGVIDAKVGANSGTLRQGSFRLDANSFGSGGFSVLNDKLAKAGFSKEMSLKQRAGNVNILGTDNVNAHKFQLTADQGAVSIDGKIDASGIKSGEVNIYGKNGVTLGSTGKILARASAKGNTGGKVTLDTVHRDDTGIGTLNLSANGGLIDVSGGVGGFGGTVHLRTGRDIKNNLTDSVINSTIQGNAPFGATLEAARIYTPADQTTVTASDISTWKTDTASFMATQPALVNHSGSEIDVLPGIEVRGNGNLTVNDLWDFMDWRYPSVNKSLPGFLTLRAGGDLNVNATLSDGFVANVNIPGFDPNADQNLIPILHNLLQPGRSWSYNLVADNNVNLANSGPDLTQVMVRTGTGGIDITAGKDIKLLGDANNRQAAAAVYTMGTPANYTRGQLLAGEIPGIPSKAPGETDHDYLNRLDKSQLNVLLRYGILNERQLGIDFLYAEYPTHGGDINLNAKGDIKGIQTGQSISDWLVRGGFWDNGRTDNRSTAWGLDVSGGITLDGSSTNEKRYFNQNIGALGGGNVNIEAGGDVRDLSVMIPTTGKPFGLMSNLDQWGENGTILNGGGDLRITAGNDIVGGEYYVGLGSGNLVAGGSIARSSIPNSNSTIGAILDVGDTAFIVQARKDINLATAMNPTMTEQTLLPGNVSDSRFFSYGTNSGVGLTSVAGNVVLWNDYAAIKALKNLPTGRTPNKFEYLVYPGTLQAAALSGDIRINNSMTLLPSADGNFDLLANGNIGYDEASGLNTLYVNMSDTDPGKLPSIGQPAAIVEGSATNVLARELLNPTLNPAILHAPNPVHRGDQSSPLIQAKNGSIAFPADILATFYMPQASSFIAGKDISNLSISAQNLSARDVTLIKAGRDIGFTTNRDSDGNIVTATSTSQFFKLGGPGQLQVLAGRNISLGGSDGIQTLGNLLNQALDSNGASINMLTGISDKVDLNGFIKKYQNAYSAQLQGLAGLSEDQQRKHLAELFTVLFEEIKRSAAAAAAAPEGQRSALYKRGFDAIQAMFPGKAYKGDLSLVFSQIKTLAGGDINLAVPGGKVDVGLAGKQGGVDKKADELGIVVQQKGNLNILAKGDINVNQSRVFSMGGGDIVAWSSKGDIDAGKGAKSVISAPKPITKADEKGNLKTIFPPIISGSGIQAIGGGNVYLAAPVGVVDAGEAGISGGQVVIAATAVIGASNISSTNGTIGVPVTVNAPVSVAGADSAAASASKAASQSTSADRGNDDDDSKKKKKRSTVILSTDLVGFGNCSVGDVKEAKSGCGGA